MGHDPTKLLLGTTGSSDRPGTSVYDSDPTTFKAGLACRLASDAALTLTKGSNQWVGISLGKSLSDIKKTCVLRAGSDVPLLLSLPKAYASVTITSYANLVSGTPDSITVGATVFTAQSGSVTPGGATFQAASSNNATGTSLAAQINAHATASTLVKADANAGVVTITALAGGTGGNAIAIAYTNNDANVGATLANASGGNLNGGSADSDDIDYVTKGAKVYIDDLTGMATVNQPGSTISDAVYVSDVLDGVAEDDSIVPAVKVDMVGGL